MKKQILLWGAILMMSYSYHAMACQFNSDCEIGSKCIKNGGIYGYCMGGMYPGNSYDEQPATNLRGGGGHTCSFDLDCEIGYTCLKSGLNGVCIRQ